MLIEMFVELLLASCIGLLFGFGSAEKRAVLGCFLACLRAVTLFADLAEIDDLAGTDDVAHSVLRFNYFRSPHAP